MVKAAATALEDVDMDKAEALVEAQRLRVEPAAQELDLGVRRARRVE